MDKNKRLLVMIFLVISVIVGVIMFTILSGGFGWDSIAIIVIVALLLAYSIPRFIINRNDNVDQDEYSKKVMRTIAARSYYVSLYTWLAMMWLSNIVDDLLPETSTKIGFGIGVMAIVFLINAIVIKLTGIKE